jgi:hypothetical protein
MIRGKRGDGLSRMPNFRDGFIKLFRRSHDPDAKLEAGVVGLDRCVVRVLPDGASGWRIEVDTTLRSSLKTPADIRFEVGAAPITVKSLSVDSSIEATPDFDTRGKSAIVLKRDAASTENWDQTAVRLVLLWNPSTRLAGGSEHILEQSTPCLVLPDMLPRVAVVGDLAGGANPGRMPRLEYGSELPDGLNAGGIAVSELDNRGAPDLLQMVIFPTSHSVRGDDQLAIAGATTRAISRDDLEAAHAYVAPLAEFVRVELDAHLPTRTVACLVDSVDETVFPVSGAYCPVTRDQVGAETRNRGKPRGVLTSLSCGFLGGGTRLWGDNAAELTLALGAAVGLRWLQASGNSSALQTAIREASDHVALAARSGEWSVTAVTRSIQLALYEGMQSVSTRHKIGKLIREYWGTYMPQEAFVDLLRSTGTRVPNVFM